MQSKQQYLLSLPAGSLDTLTKLASDSGYTITHPGPQFGHGSKNDFLAALCMAYDRDPKRTLAALKMAGLIRVVPK